jgi:hypothetical protein
VSSHQECEPLWVYVRNMASSPTSGPRQDPPKINGDLQDVARGVHEESDELLDRRRWTKALSRCRPCSPKPRFARSVPCWFGAMAATNCMGGSNRPSPLLRLASVRAQVSERRHPPVPRKAKQPPPPGVEKQGCIHSGRLSDPDRLPEGADGEDRSQTLTCEARAQ